ncbi:MAG: aldo/keto reductase [Lacisediminihabitans sp.]
MNTLGRTGLRVSPLCVGTSSWGVLRDGETSEQADARIDALADIVLSSPATNIIDTSNTYGGGRSELLIGAALTRRGGLADAAVLQTKLDRDPQTGSFAADRMWRSLEESLERLDVDHLQVMYLHDPETVGFDAVMADGGAVDALVEMKRQGVVDHIGISGGPIPMLIQFVETGLFDALVTHNRWTLVDRSAGALFDVAVAHGVGVCNAAPWGAGALLGDAALRDRYGYRPTPPAVRAAIDAMADLCAAAEVPLRAAALQFSLRDPRVATTIVGVSSLDRWEQTLDDLTVSIPDALWADLDALQPPASEALDAR